MKLGVVWVVVLWSLNLASPVSGQTISAAARQRAQRLVNRCNQFLDKKECAAALSVCTDAYAVAPWPGLLVNMAVARTCLGDFSIAALILEQFLKEPGSASPAQVEAARDELRQVLEQARHAPTPSPVVTPKSQRPTSMPLMSPMARQRAQTMLRRCNTLLDQGQCGDALRTCNDTYAIYPYPELLLTLERVHRCLGRDVEALALLEQFLAEPGGSLAATVQAARAEWAELRAKRPPQGQLRLSWTPADALVYVDEVRMLGQGEVTLGLAPGKHRLRVEPPVGTRMVSREVPLTVLANQLETLHIRLALATEIQLTVPLRWRVALDYAPITMVEGFSAQSALLRVEPGNHSVLAMTPGGKRLERVVTIQPGARFALSLFFPRLSRRLMVPLVLVSAGVLSIAVGTGLFFAGPWQLCSYRSGPDDQCRVLSYPTPAAMALTVGGGIGVLTGGIWAGWVLANHPR